MDDSKTNVAETGASRKRGSIGVVKRRNANPSLPKAPTFVPGFDSITHGGLPRARTTLVMGSTGAGKTVFALQSLVGGAREGGEPGIFVAFEENSRQIITNAATFGWNLPVLEKKHLFFLDASLSPETVRAGDFDLTGMLAMLKRKVDEIGAKRIVFDGIDALLGMLDHPESERRELHRVREWIDRTGLTAIITGKIDEGYPRRYSFMQYMVDCVVNLRSDVEEGSLNRSLRVIKYRGSAFTGQESPLAITAKGVQLLEAISDARPWKVSSENITSGVPRLDTMLSGGYYRGNSVLISGASGTAKSTLASAFVDAACKRKERTLLVTFEEPIEQVERNLLSIGLELRPHLASGVLYSYSTRTSSVKAVDHLLELKSIMSQHGTRNLIIDPISAMRQSNGVNAFSSAAMYLLDYAKTQGITVVTTSLTDTSDGAGEINTGGISNAVDTWIHLSYVIQDGERNRALTIVKSRGVGHSNQVRELLVSDDGVTLADAYISDGKLLMGVARWEKEASETAERETKIAEGELKQRQLELARTESEARLAAITRELETRNTEIKLHTIKTLSQEKLRASHRGQLYKMRRGDTSQSPEGPDLIGRSKKGRPKVTP